MLGAGILAVVVFGGLCIRHNVPAIEADLANRASQALKKQRMGWASVEMSGRDLTLTGVAPDDDALAAATEIARVAGVRLVASNLTTVVDYVASGPRAAEARRREATVTPVPKQPVKTSEPARTRIVVVDGRLVLEGAAPGERQRRDLVELAQSRFGIATVEAQLRDSGTPAPDGWLAAAALALDIADELVFGEVTLVDQALHVTGVTATREGDERVRRLVAESLPAGYAGTAQTGARTELESVLRTTPALAQRLSQRAANRTEPLPPPEVLAPSDCELRFRETLGDRRILFDTASATLTADSRQLLDELAVVLKSCSGTRLSIEGHTDDQGLLENNLALSQQRAEAVMQHLVARGISLGRMTAQGFGEESPLVPNETAEDRAVNRRIEFVFENR